MRQGVHSHPFTRTKVHDFNELDTFRKIVHDFNEVDSVRKSLGF